MWRSRSCWSSSLVQLTRQRAEEKIRQRPHAAGKRLAQAQNLPGGTQDRLWGVSAPRGCCFTQTGFVHERPRLHQMPSARHEKGHIFQRKVQQCCRGRLDTHAPPQDKNQTLFAQFIKKNQNTKPKRTTEVPEVYICKEPLIQ